MKNKTHLVNTLVHSVQLESDLQTLSSVSPLVASHVVHGAIKQLSAEIEIDIASGLNHMALFKLTKLAALEDQALMYERKANSESIYLLASSR
jgi:hypothetical protein